MELFESSSATVGVDGTAHAVLQPLRTFERWDITRMTVQATSQTLVPTAKVYRNAVTPSQLVDGTHTGTLDHSDTSLRLQNGERLIVLWEGADVGTVCTVTIEGTIRGR